MCFFCLEKRLIGTARATKTDGKRMSKKPIELIDRKSGQVVQESVMGCGALRFAYETLLGKCLHGLLFYSSGFSRLMGAYYDSGLSKRSIADLTAIPGCAPEEAEFPPEHYASFNDFFARRLKPGLRPFDASPGVISSPADGRVFVFENLKSTDAVPVKGARQSLNDLCCEDLGEKKWAVAVVRLAPVDYHRFHFPCDCLQKDPPQRVKGKYHSVNPIALAVKPDLFVENTRQITRLESEKFGSFRYLEVGAFGVGSIIQFAEPGSHLKQDEKGCFKFGGSTVILMFENERIRWSDDLLKNSAEGRETIVRLGETLAEAR